MQYIVYIVHTTCATCDGGSRKLNIHIIISKVHAKKKLIGLLLDERVASRKFCER